MSGVLLFTPGKSAPVKVPVLNINLLESEPSFLIPSNTSERKSGPPATENEKQLLALESCQKNVIHSAVAWVKSKTDCARKPVVRETNPTYQPGERKYKGVMPLYTSELPS
ncbi:hypothetical protein TH61_00735 [Rufibacter sp. DG15C]|nr:hypothetical protein TH61_00735 [Rufibacter sp. DG15C]